MSECFVGEIRMFGGNYAPEGWHLCDGTALKVIEYQMLYSLIGTTYGGDGRIDFALPDLRGRLPVGIGQGAGLTNRTLAQSFGSETITLTEGQMPSHAHPALASTDLATENKPASDRVVGATPSGYVAFLPASATGNTMRAFDDTTISFIGSSQPHDNMMPTLAINFIIALQGIYPTHS